MCMQFWGPFGSYNLTSGFATLTEVLPSADLLTLLEAFASDLSKAAFEKQQDSRSIGVCFYKELNQTFPVFKMKDLTVMLEASFPFDEQRDRLCWAL